MCFGGSKAPEVTTTPDQMEQQRVNAELWNYYAFNYKPLIEKYTARVSDPTVKKEEENKVAGELNAQTMKNVDPSKVTSNPVANEKALMSIAGKGSVAQVQGQGGTRSRKLGEMQNVIDIGRGQATTAQADLGEIAGQSVKAEIAGEELSQKAKANVQNAYGSIAGAMAAGLMKASDKKTKERDLEPV
jgi:hypothetical protein